MVRRIMPTAPRFTVLHYVGCDVDRGGIVSVVRALAATGRFRCVLGVNPKFEQRRSPPLATLELPWVAGEKLGFDTFWRARFIARTIQTWLRADPARVFHGHSRAGLAVALWLRWFGESRVVVSVHCYGRQRWFYRWASRRLGDRLFWLSPAMKRYYAAGDASWSQCVPGCVSLAATQAGKPSKAAPKRLRLGGIGALVRWKGWHVIVEALAALPAEVRDRISFRHIGGSDGSADSQSYATELRALTIASGLDDTIQWLGEQPSSEALLCELDCLVVASQNEPFSVAVLEALAAGVPVLAADSGGARDVLTPQCGWFFRTGDAQDLARFIVTLAEGKAFQAVEITPGLVQPFAAPVIAERWRQIYAGTALPPA